MNLDEILNGLAEALELERELGVRSVEFDRALLTGREATRDAIAEDARREARDAITEGGRVAPVSSRSSHDLPSPVSSSRRLPLVFLHDRALSPAAVTMMAKIVTAMHQTPETAPILFTGTRPDACVTVVLGLRALRHWFPGEAGSPGQWITPGGVPNVLVTYSPDFILRPGVSPDAVQKLKREMWTSLKAAIQRIESDL